MPSSSSERPSPRPPRPALRLLGGVLLAFCLSACQATVRVGVDTHRDGSGVVTVTALLDRDAAHAIPDLAQQLRSSDLQKDGWKIDGPTPAPNNGVQVVASKPFSNPAQAIQVLGELSGRAASTAQGPFRDFRIDQHQGFLRTTTTFHGLVDLTCGLRCFGDAALQQQLGGADLGIDPTKLQSEAGIILDRIFRFEVAVRLPGSLQSSNAPTEAGNGAQWQPKLGDKVELTATSQAWDSPRVVLLGIAVLAGLVLLALLIYRAVRRRRPPAPVTSSE